MKQFVLPAFLAVSLCLCACAKNVETESEQTPKELDVASLQASQDTDQLIVVDYVNENDVTLRLYEKKAAADGSAAWGEVLKTNARVGRNGLGKTMEGDEKTPSGVYMFTEAFGIADNPGTAFKYTKLTKNHYWDDNPKSRTYNTLITSKKSKRKVKGEHLIEGTQAYQYVLVMNYNPDRRPEVGSAVFLRCSTEETTTSGSITVDKETMKALLMQLKPTAKILIAEHDELPRY